MALTYPFRVWIQVATSDQPLVRQLECHQACQRQSSTIMQQAHQDTRALHQKSHS